MKRSTRASLVVIAASLIGAGAVGGTVAACGSSGSGAGGGGDDSGIKTPTEDGASPILVDSGVGDSNEVNLMQDTGVAPPPMDSGVIYGCMGLMCQINQQCPDGGTTSVSGTVYDPAGNNPLYNVVVYVPNTTPDPLTPGVSTAPNACSCASLYTGTPVAAAVTDAKGNFTMTNVPNGSNIPLVIQIGKWRKQITLPTVNACVPNPITTQLKLPSNQSEGDIPSIAISTGGADTLECLLRRIGVDATEYGPGASGTGRIHIFQGSAANGETSAVYAQPDGSLPGTPYSSQGLWSSVSNLMHYDITILSCEGQETQDIPPRPDGGPSLTASDQQALLDYVNAGGRVFTSHYHYAWFNTGPFASYNIANWTPGGNAINEADNNPITSYTQGDWINAKIITTFSDAGVFAKGQAMSAWLSNTGSLGTGDAEDELHINGAKDNATLAGLTNTPSQAWLAADNQSQGEVLQYPGQAVNGTAYDAGGATQYLSFNTPIEAGVDEAGAPAYCGRVVYSDLHVGAASEDYVNDAGGPEYPEVPTECADKPLSPQEKALEFMLFDLSSCVTPDMGNGMAPPPVIIAPQPK
jgi:hypothetical protein